MEQRDRQATLASELEFQGVGLHSGFKVTVRLVPAPPETGIVFRRPDLSGFEIEALRRNVAKVNHATTLMKRGVMISTVEHILSAVYGLGIDNLYVDVDSLEIPILDGSARPYTEAIQRVGFRLQDSRRQYLQVLRPFCWGENDKSVAIEPSDCFRVSCVIDFPHPLIRRQELHLVVDADAYARQVSYARTFGFYREVEAMLKNNLIRGGSFDNAIVLSDDGIMNGELRQPDEFVRHKTLDLIGDVALLGKPLLGRLKAYCAGHAAHTTFVGKFLEQKDAYRIVTLEEAHASPNKNSSR